MGLFDFFRRKPLIERPEIRDALIALKQDLENSNYEASRPPTQRDLPITSILDFATVPSVRNALKLHITGNFEQSAQLVEAMIADEHIAAALDQRFKTLLGKPLHFNEPEELEGEGPSPAVEFFQKQWDVILPEPEAIQLLIWGEMLGIGVAENVWDKTDPTAWIPKIKIWNPRFVWWNWGERCFYLNTVDGPVRLQHGDGQWLLHTPKGVSRGWIGGLVRRLAIPYLIRSFTYRDWARHGEVHGMPTRIAQIPSSATDVDRKRFLREVTLLSNENTVVCPRMADGTGFDVVLREVNAQGWQSFDGLITKTEDSIATTILGQTLTMGAKSGGLGTGGVAQVHNEVRMDYSKHDAKTFAQCLYEGTLRPTSKINFNDPDAAPKLEWEVEPADDLQEKATTLLALGQALTALEGAGAPLDVDEIAEEFQIPILSEADREALKQKKMKDAVDNAQAMAAAVPDAADDNKATGPTSRPVPKKSSAASRTSRPTRGQLQGQLYADNLTDNSIRRARDLMHGDLEALLGVVHVARDFDDLRERLKKLYRGMDPARLQDLVRKALVLAELNGRDSVLEDV